MPEKKYINLILSFEKRKLHQEFCKVWKLLNIATFVLYYKLLILIPILIVLNYSWYPAIILGQFDVLKIVLERKILNVVYLI